jgi:PAS domain S-box-containing protein
MMSTRNSHRHLLVLLCSLTLFLMLSALGGWSWRQLRQQELERGSERLADRAEGLLHAIDFYLRERFNDIAMIGNSLSELSSEKRLDEFAGTASLLAAREPSFFLINLLDTASVCKASVPKGRAPQILGVDLSTLPGRKNLHVRARETGTVQCSPPVELRSGETGIIAWYPVFTQAKDSARFAGYIASVFQIEDILTRVAGKSLAHKDILRLSIDTIPAYDSRGENDSAAVDSSAASAAIVSRTIAGRHWEAALKAGRPPVPFFAPWSAGTALAVHVGFSAVVSLLLYLLLAGELRRRDAAWALKRAREKDHTFFDALGDPVLLHEPRDGRIVYANQSARELLGCAAKQVVGSAPDLIGTGVGRGARDEGMRRIRAALSGRPQHWETPLRCHDGQTVWAEIDLRAVPIGGQEYVVGMIRDISQRIRAEEDLQRSMQFLEVVLDKLPVGLLVVDRRDGRAHYVNERFCAILGCSHEAVMDHDAFDRLVLPDKGCREDVLSRIDRLENARDGDAVLWQDARVRMETGDDRLVSVNAVWVPSQQLILYIVEDVTERRKAEEALRTSEQRYRAVVEDQSEFIVRWKPDTTRTFVNDAYCRHFRKPAHEMIGSSILAQVVEEDRDEIRKKMARLTPKHPSETGVHRVLLPDGTVGWQEWTDHAIFDDRGEMVELQSIGRDVSARKQAEFEREQLEEQLRHSQKMEAVGRLAGGIAHDFNNLLAAIIGYAELAVCSMPEHDEKRKDIMQIREAGRRASRLTQQLLAFSRKQVLETRPLNLSKQVTGLEKMLRRVIGEDVVLTTFLQPEIGTVKADPGQIDQILLNMAINARDAMPHGGRLTIETANVHLDEEYARNHAGVRPGSHVMLSISDSGDGMPAEVLHHVFDPFFTTKEAGKGTGLGLSTVYGIVKQHGGSVWVYSEEETGTTFKVFLPRIDGPGESEERAAAGQLHRGQGTILLVEDEAVVRDLTSSVLRNAGYSVVVAGNAEEAKRLFNQRREEIDLLLTDVIMPGESGDELYEGLVMQRPGLRVLYMSGYTDNVIAQHGILEEGEHFLQKPFSVTSLTDKVWEVMS